ncbi:Hypothetical_protein [Hexamita inflata]|uniref:Hypothetical_protein n=1 Tax=Hexamita inflata TaxID=28002 RepID=A0AA86V368_9EUKA|nr:Hypothetical protein HINF_LOCUS62147 [Hexamita inflata]
MFSLKSFRKHASGVISFSGFINSSSSFNLVRGLSGATLLTLQAVKLSLVSIVIYWRGEISMFLLQPEFCSLSHENERIVLTRTIFYYRTNKEALADFQVAGLLCFSDRSLGRGSNLSAYCSKQKPCFCSRKQTAGYCQNFQQILIS